MPEQTLKSVPERQKGAQRKPPKPWTIFEMNVRFCKNVRIIYCTPEISYCTISAAENRDPF